MNASRSSPTRSCCEPVLLALLLTPQHSPLDLTLHGQSLRTLQGQTATPLTAPLSSSPLLSPTHLLPAFHLPPPVARCLTMPLFFIFCFPSLHGANDPTTENKSSHVVGGREGNCARPQLYCFNLNKRKWKWARE